MRIRSLFKSFFDADKNQKRDNLYRQQIAVSEQKVVMRTIAETCARNGMSILEVGSWCGDSAVELGAIAKKHGGKLVCIDWWKGNVGTNLADAATRSDIYSIFWDRIMKAGLDDTVIPIRAKSDDVAVILRNDFFDMIYIDGDHRYSQVSSDIKNYAPLLRDGGILCGDDCEGRLDDFDPGFLAKGKDTDYHETVHCGVVLAVGESFESYSVDYNIWSVRRTGDHWASTNLAYEGIQLRRQYHPPLIESYRKYNLIRYGRNVWALPQSLGAIDVTQEVDRVRPEVLHATSLQGVRDLIDQAIGSMAQVEAAELPVLLDSFRGYNIVSYRNQFYGLPQKLGPIDLPTVETSKFPDILIDRDRFALQKKINRLLGG